jgi:hypothetical protein
VETVAVIETLQWVPVAVSKSGNANADHPQQARVASIEKDSAVTDVTRDLRVERWDEREDCF